MIDFFLSFRNYYLNSVCMFVFVYLFVACIYIVCLSRAPLKISFTEWTPRLKITVTLSYCELVVAHYQHP